MSEYRVHIDYLNNVEIRYAWTDEQLISVLESIKTVNTWRHLIVSTIDLKTIIGEIWNSNPNKSSSLVAIRSDGIKYFRTFEDHSEMKSYVEMLRHSNYQVYEVYA